MLQVITHPFKSNGKTYLPESTESAYLLSSYNMVRCGICGVAWDEHSDKEFCNRYKPPAELLASLPKPVAKVIVRNHKPPEKKT